MVDISTILYLGKQPITPDAPCGSSIDESDEDFNDLRVEIDKTQKLTGISQIIDWEKILETSTKILGEKSKNLQVAGYLAWALFERHRYPGMAVALTIYHDLIEKYWQGLFPLELRGRKNAVTWLAKKFVGTVQQRDSDKADFEAVQRCEGLVKCIDVLLQEKFAGNEPGFGGLYSLLYQFLVREDTGKEQQGQAPLSEEPARQESSHQGTRESVGNNQQSVDEKDVGLASTQTVDSELQKAMLSARNAALSRTQDSSLAKTSESSKSASTSLPIATSEPAHDVTIDSKQAAEQAFGRVLGGCETTLRQVTTFLLRNKLDDPLPYYLVRSGAWLKIWTLPDIEQGKRTKAWNSEPHRAQSFEEDLRNGRYAELIPAVEVTILASPFWLDAHYYTVQALEKLGPAYEAAKGMVTEHLASFIRRLPGVLELCFDDGSPFASEKTREWIHSQVLKSARKRDGAELRAHTDLPVQVLSSSDAKQALSEGDETVRDAMQLATAGKLLEGMALLHTRENSSTSQRERFLWRLQQARLCIHIEAFEVAAYQLEFLDEQIARFGLEAWEPSLCVAVLKLLIVCYHRISLKTKETSSTWAMKTEQVYARLCRLDVAVALELHDTMQS